MNGKNASTLQNGHTPFFSVVIPAYNCADFLREALASLAAQSDQDFEVLISDSRSNDATAVVLYEFPTLRGQVVTNDLFGNIAASRNLAASRARGQWIAFLDADDFWMPDKLAVMRSAIEAHPKAVIVCHAEIIYKDGQECGVQTYGPNASNLASLLIFSGNRFSTSASVVRRDIFERLGGFDTDWNLVTAEDYDLWIRIALCGEAVFVNTPHGYFRIHGTNTSARLQRHAKAVKTVLYKHTRHYVALYPWAVARRLFRFTARQAVELWKNGHYLASLGYTLQSFWYATRMAVSWRPGLSPYPPTIADTYAAQT